MQSGKRENGETTSRPEAGQEFHATYSSLPIRNQQGELVGILETVMDQTEAKQALAAVERQNWLRTGQTELNDVMRGEQEVITLTKNVIAYLSQYLNADIGTVYVTSETNGNTRLRLAGSYAYTRRNSGENSVKIGDGLLGQVASEREVVLYSDIPEDYLPIKTEDGYTTPKQVLISPLLYQDELKGVLEVGTTGEFSDQDLEFLEQASENIAVALHSAKVRQQMQGMLREKGDRG
jgi:transcriptional regulator with GAF, ATPase, and Fis domain